MILTKTPLRISFAGGGSDYFHDNLDIDGRVVVTTINKYIYVLLNKKHDDKIRVSYSETENVDSSNQLNHQLIRETLGYFNNKKGIELVTSADIPSSGSGLASSSALIVGMVNALSPNPNKMNSKKKISEQASEIEIDYCKKPIGFQDHYSTAFGGLNSIEFTSNKKVIIKKIELNKKRENLFKKNLLLFYTGINRKADTILKKITNTKVQIDNHERLASLATNFQHELVHGDLLNCGKILHENWNIKKKLNKVVSSFKIDEIYDIAIKSGAVGGKLLGAGGGGYFLFYALKKDHKKIIHKLKFLKNIPFDFESMGTQKFKI
jgi:D-glycero-alpha-D-manno-heptose-7-phosphate kinase